MPQSDAQKEIEHRLTDLRAKFGETVSIDSLAEIIGELIITLHGDINTVDLQIYRDLESLAHYIKAAREEIAAIGPEEVRTKHLRTASDQLDAVVAATEDATGSILDSVERIEEIASKLDDQESASGLTAEVTHIYEACNFQDITGQRIGKVVKALHHIESKLQGMSKALGHNIENTDANIIEESSAAEIPPSMEEGLLNGPQLPGNSTSQEEIDALLKN